MLPAFPWRSIPLASHGNRDGLPAFKALTAVVLTPDTTRYRHQPGKAGRGAPGWFRLDAGQIVGRCSR
jgi:hypothetical protein